MKLNITTFVFLLLFVGGSTVYGQGYTFKVLANKGTNKIKSGSEWQPMKTGAVLQKDDEIDVSENAYLGLVHTSGKTLELKTKGKYKVSDLSAKVDGNGSSVASKYADFVLSKMSAEGKKNRLIATGSVDRGEHTEIQILMPASSPVYNDNALVKWDGSEENEQYVVTLQNMFDDTLLTINTDKPNVNLDLKSDKIAKENVVLVTVATKDGKKHSKTYAIKRLRPDDAAEVKETLTELKSAEGETTALNSYILAGFYEENNLLVDALGSYQDAIAMAPDVDSYKEAYTEFLLRNQLGN